MKFVKCSPKRSAAFDRIKEDPNDDSISGGGIRSFCPTRWTVRGESIGSILENYTILKKLWDDCLETNLVPDVKSRKISACERILKITDNLSKTLQGKALSAAEGQAVAKLTVKLFFGNVECIRKRTDVNEPCLPRKRKAPRRFEVGEGVHYHPPSVVQPGYNLLSIRTLKLEQQTKTHILSK